MGDALKPCPFCGGNARIEDLDDGGSCVVCEKCMSGSAVHFDRKENMVAEWNRRADLRLSPELRRTVEMCEARATRMMNGESAGIGPIVSVLRDILRETE